MKEMKLSEQGDVQMTLLSQVQQDVLTLTQINNYILMQEKKKKVKRTDLPAFKQITSISLNKFLFKRTKSPQENESIGIRRIQPNITNRSRFKSQISQQFQASKSLKLKTAASTYYKPAEQSNGLSLRIMKWHQMKKRAMDKDNHRQTWRSTKRKSENSDSSPFQFKRQIQNRSKFRFIPNANSRKMKTKFYFRQNEETNKIIENYKLTQRIVFYEQIQQKRDKQRELISKSLKIQKASISKQKQTWKQKNSERFTPNELVPCRPWSGKSYPHSTNRIKTQDLQDFDKVNLDK